MSISPASAFLKARGKPAPSLPVSIHLVDDSGTEQTDAEGAPAVFRFVSDKVKSDAGAGASKALAELSAKSVPITDEIRAAYEQAHFLHAAIRDRDNPAAVFFDGPDEARSMLVASERLRLLAAYQGWIEEKFPTDFDTVKFKEAMTDAETFTVRTLLIKYGFATTRNLLISSALTLSKQATQP